MFWLQAHRKKFFAHKKYNIISAHKIAQITNLNVNKIESL